MHIYNVSFNAYLNMYIISFNLIFIFNAYWLYTTFVIILEKEVNYINKFYYIHKDISVLWFAFNKNF